MKKLLASAVAVAAIAAPAMAQGMPGFVPAEYENSAMIEQIGAANSAIVNQVFNGPINGASLATVLQNGDANALTVMQRSGISEVGTGFDNEADIAQSADRADTIVRQIHDYSQTQSNRVVLRQRTDDARARLFQRGDRNFIRLRQLNPSFEANAIIHQNGYRNTARVDQTGISGRTRIFQGEFGGGAVSTAPQANESTVDVVTSGTNAEIYVEQFGFGHTGNVNESGVDGQVTIETDGYFNDASVIQAGMSGTAYIQQLGTSFSNLAAIEQTAFDVDSSATITQSGWYAESSILQTLDDGHSGGNNTATSIQSGLGANDGDIYSSIVQDGSSNSAIVNQASSVGSSMVTQTGGSHSANVSQ